MIKGARSNFSIQTYKYMTDLLLKEYHENKRELSEITVLNGLINNMVLSNKRCAPSGQKVSLGVFLRGTCDA